jgi:hypothetical protein
MLFASVLFQEWHKLLGLTLKVIHMNSLKIKGNWNQQKSKIKLKFSEFDEDDEIYGFEESILRTGQDLKKTKKKLKKAKEKEW